MSIYLENLALIKEDWRDVPTRVNTQETDLAGPKQTNTEVMPKIGEIDSSKIGKQYRQGEQHVFEPEVI